MEPENDPSPSPIVDPQGRPARASRSLACPGCGAGPEKRVASCGFGQRMTLCGVCGHDFNEVFRG